MSEVASAIAIRIVRSVQAHFPTGGPQTGSAFVVAPGKLATCAHVVRNEAGQTANRVILTDRTGATFGATVSRFSDSYDLACLDAPSDQTAAPQVDLNLPTIGRPVILAGSPRGVKRPAIFPAMISDVGAGFIKSPRCELIQIAGMLNNGNSGGPLLDSSNGNILGVVTAKYVPLMMEIEKLLQFLKTVPQAPDNVAIGGIKFGPFFNFTIASVGQLAEVLRLVQVGTGWAVPSQYFGHIGV